MKRKWTKEQERLLAERYSSATSGELQALLSGRTWYAIKQHAVKLGLTRIFHFTEEQLEELKKTYSDTLTSDFAARYGCSIYAVRNVAHKLGLKKNPDFLRRIAVELMGNPNHPGRAHQFKKGSIPQNKGRKQSEYMTAEAIELTKATRFQVGQKSWRHKSVGYERVNVDGYVEVKVAEPRTFKLKHRIVWEAHNGKIPKGSNVQFRNGNPLNCDIGNLYLISRKEQMLQNSGSMNLPDRMVATYMATSSRKPDIELRDELLKHPELLEVKRQQIRLNRSLKKSENGKRDTNTRTNDRQHL